MAQAQPMEIVVVDTANAKVGTVALPGWFGEPVEDGPMFEQVLSQLASRRSGSAATKTRAFVRGGGKKPWKQKGTGRARAGSSRSPIWRGGAVIFGPQPRSYAYRLPRQARRAALRNALAQKARDGQLTIVQNLGVNEPKTKRMVAVAAGLGIEGSALFVLPARDRSVELSVRNIPRLHVTTVDGLNVYDILRHERLILVRDALPLVQSRLEP